MPQRLLLEELQILRPILMSKLLMPLARQVRPPLRPRRVISDGEQLIAVQSEERDSLDLYNLACYQALNGQPEPAKKTLELAIGTAGDRYRRHAAGDPDFAAMRASGALDQLLRGVAAEEPEKSIPPVPGAPG